MVSPSLAIPEQKQFCAPESRRLVLIAAILASTMGFIDMTVVALATPAIRVDLGASLVDAQWISNSYMLLLSSLVLLGGAAGDIFGTRNAFAFGIAVFVVASIGCALAPDALSLILTRGAQGLGAAFMVPGSLAVIAKAYPAEEPRRRDRELGRRLFAHHGCWAASGRPGSFARRELGVAFDLRVEPT